MLKGPIVNSTLYAIACLLWASCAAPKDDSPVEGPIFTIVPSERLFLDPDKVAQPGFTLEGSFDSNQCGPGRPTIDTETHYRVTDVVCSKAGAAPSANQVERIVRSRCVDGKFKKETENRNPQTMRDVTHIYGPCAVGGTIQEVELLSIKIVPPR